MTYEDKYLLFNYFFNGCERALYPIYAQIPIHLMDETICEVVDSLGNNTDTTAFLFSRLNLADLKVEQLKLSIQKLDALVQNQNKVIWSQQTKILELQRQLANK